jgi:hypothetical protein
LTYRRSYRLTMNTADLVREVHNDLAKANMRFDITSFNRITIVQP